MALSEDQRALMRLLLEGEDYGSIATLLGDEPEAVRERAHRARDEVGTDEPKLAEAITHRVAQLDGIESEAPRVPRSRRPRLSVWLPLAIGVVALAVIAVVVSGVFDSDSSPSSSSAPAPDREDVVVIKLNPVGGASAKGEARLLRIEDLPALDVDVVGLDPSGPDETYIVWLYNSPTKAFPLVFLDVGENGRLEGRAPIPAAATPLLASFEGLDVSLAQKDEAAAAIAQAAQGSGIPRHVGRSVVRGKFPG